MNQEPCPDRTRDILAEIGNVADAFTPPVLYALANGPILNPNGIFLPCGRVSLEEAKRRALA